MNTSPGTDFNDAIRWRRESIVNASIDRLIDSGFFYWGQWQLSGPLTVLEDGAVSTWQAMASEYRFEDVREAAPCRARGGIELFAWRPLADSTGIDAVFLHMLLPESPDDAVFGERRPCPDDIGGFNIRTPHLGRFVLRGQQAGERWTAFAGQAHVQAAGAGAAAPPCRLASGRSWPDRCEEILVGVTIRVSMRPSGPPDDTSSAPARELVIGPGAVPGVRRFQACSERIALACARPPAAFAHLPSTTDPSSGSFSVSEKYVTRWKSRTVLRTTLQVRFDRAVSDEAIVDVLNREAARAESRGPAGTLVLQVPDPGPVPGAFGRMVERWQRLPGVVSVYPMAGTGGRWTPAVRAGRLKTRLVDRGGAPVSDGLFCHGLNPDGRLDESPYCRATDARGAASLDSLPAFDFPVFAACKRTGTAAVLVDSTAVRVQPGRSVNVKFRAADCP